MRLLTSHRDTKVATQLLLIEKVSRLRKLMKPVNDGVRRPIFERLRNQLASRCWVVQTVECFFQRFRKVVHSQPPNGYGVRVVCRAVVVVS